MMCVLVHYLDFYLFLSPRYQLLGSVSVGVVVSGGCLFVYKCFFF